MDILAYLADADVRGTTSPVSSLEHIPAMMGPMPPRLLLSALWFFLVLFSYYVLKPVRDALATETRLFGPLYLATFLCPSTAFKMIVAVQKSLAGSQNLKPLQIF